MAKADDETPVRILHLSDSLFGAAAGWGAGPLRAVVR